MISSSVRAPRLARISRTCSATKLKNVTTWSGVPLNLARRSARWVAMPVGQVLRWHCRAMAQPIATSGAVPNPKVSAPSSAASTTSRPLLNPPSVRTSIRCRRPLATSMACASASPSSHGLPACLMDESGDAPVPPLWPAIST
jgi:hypothetical protein